MATVDDIVSRVRLELADQATGYSQTLIGDGVTTDFQLDYYPLNAETLTAFIGSQEIDPSVIWVEERTGRIVFETPPAVNASVLVRGTHYRYFSNDDLARFVTDATAQHTAGRYDAYNRTMRLETLPMVEEYPLALLATTMALYALATDASFDIDIHTPDGVGIPRSERYRQLLQMMQMRKEQYEQLCAALNIGLNAIQVFTFRRISKATGRYVPVYRPQEIDDATPPVRIYLPIPSYGAPAMPEPTGTYDLQMVQGDAYEATIDFDFDLHNYTVTAEVLAYAGATKPLQTFAASVVDISAGQVSLSLTPDQTSTLPLNAIWGLKITDVLDSTNVTTLVSGSVYVQRRVTV